MNVAHDRLQLLLKNMVTEDLAPEHNVLHLRAELADHYKDARFETCSTMGEIIHASLESLVHRLSHPSISQSLPISTIADLWSPA